MFIINIIRQHHHPQHHYCCHCQYIMMCVQMITTIPNIITVVIVSTL